VLLNLCFSSALSLTAVLSSTVGCKPDADGSAKAVSKPDDSAKAVSAAESLKVGSAAPALQVSRWVKGDGPSGFEKGKVYVVEFWATWCKPCLEAIPHLTQMAREYGDKVTFVGVNVWEEAAGKTADLEGKVDAFVRDMGDKMDYYVARDTASGDMGKTWLLAAGQNGIPCAFIVDGNGKVAWIGHPITMNKAIDKVLASEKAHQ
jgi:thiol-disulfide isomerase/thioredoxin